MDLGSDLKINKKKSFSLSLLFYYIFKCEHVCVHLLIYRNVGVFSEISNCKVNRFEERKNKALKCIVSFCGLKSRIPRTESILEVWLTTQIEVACLCSHSLKYTEGHISDIQI